MDIKALRVELASQYSQWTSQLSEYDWSVIRANGHNSSHNMINRSVQPMNVTALTTQLFSQHSKWTSQLSEQDCQSGHE